MKFKVGDILIIKEEKKRWLKYRKIIDIRGNYYICRKSMTLNGFFGKYIMSNHYIIIDNSYINYNVCKTPLWKLLNE